MKLASQLDKSLEDALQHRLYIEPPFFTTRWQRVASYPPLRHRWYNQLCQWLNKLARHQD